MAQPHVITDFIREHYPGYQEFMAVHFPVKNDTISEDAHAEFLVAILPEVKTVFHPDDYAGGFKKHLPEKIAPETLAVFAKQFFDFHFNRTRDRRNERLVVFYKCVAWLALVQFVVVLLPAGILLFLLFNIPALLFFLLAFYSIFKAIRRSVYRPLVTADHIMFAANLLFNIVLLYWIVSWMA